jgi:hypothetical protein
MSLFTMVMPVGNLCQRVTQWQNFRGRNGFSSLTLCIFIVGIGDKSKQIHKAG